VYRGLGGMVLDDKWFVQDKRNTRGGVELGFLSTTLNRSTALEYSGVMRGRGIILEIDVGAIDCGAQLDCLSQYPGEILVDDKVQLMYAEFKLYIDCL
jgi:NLR family CARD domain-containing protein 3